MQLNSNLAILALLILVGGILLTSALPRYVFLMEHNSERSRLRLPLLTWDPALAKSASDYASRCVFRHSVGRNYGENLYASFPKQDDSVVARLAVTAWLREKSLVTSNWSCLKSLTCGHYTQIVWRSTKRIGCAVAHCAGNLANHVVCQYSPPGNVIGQTPF